MIKLIILRPRRLDGIIESCMETTRPDQAKCLNLPGREFVPLRGTACMAGRHHHLGTSP